MNVLQAALSGSILFILILLILYLILRTSENKQDIFWIFIIGAAGWIIALLLRIMPLNLINSSLNDGFLQGLIGASFAGIFEEILRFVLILLFKPIQKDRKRGPLTLGLGWTSVEIGYLFFFAVLPGVSNEILPWTVASLFLVERLIVSFFHIAMSFIVFAAVYEKWPWKFGLYLAIILHFALDFLIPLWYFVFFPDLLVTKPIWFYWSIELAFFCFTMIIILFTSFIWIPYYTKKITIIEFNEEKEERKEN